MALSLNHVVKIIEEQTIIPNDDPIIRVARKTIECANSKEFMPISASVQSTFSDDGDKEIFSTLNISMTFAITPNNTIDYDIRRYSSDNGVTYIWCGPSHGPATDQAVEMYVDWISTAIDISR